MGFMVVTFAIAFANISALTPVNSSQRWLMKSKEP
jgi:hypothetical protein